MLGGYPSLTAAVVIITGILGAMAGPEFLRMLGIRDRIAKGAALGTASHGIGTTRAIQEGEEEGAMSSLAIGAAGIITSIAAPMLIRLFL
jgi:putative effector of murein hydrolase